MGDNILCLVADLVLIFLAGVCAGLDPQTAALVALGIEVAWQILALIVRET
jgi:hypothetical protein